MLSKIIYCSGLFFFLVNSAAGQSLVLPKTPLQQRTTGANGQDELLSLTVNWRGDLATVGNVARGNHGAQDICFVAFDAQLNLLVNRHIGRQGIDGAGQIAALPDGRYLLAGYSSQPSERTKARVQYAGKSDGWLLVLDEKGETQHELLLGTAADDAFVAAAVCPDGSAWLVGTSDDHAWVVRLSSDFEVLWERRIQHQKLPTHAAAAALAPNGNLFIAGGIHNMDSLQLWMAGFDTNGQLTTDQIYPSAQAENGTGIVALDDQNIAIVGTAKHARNRENGFLGILDHKGVMRHYQSLGGREYDQMQALIRLNNGHLLAAGGSASFERGSRRISAWLSVFTAEGVAKQNEYYGSKLDDEASALFEHPDGRLFAVGTTARQVLKMRQGWLFQLTERMADKAPPGSLQAKLYDISYPKNGISLTNERVFIPFLLENTSKKGQCNLRAIVSARDASTTAMLQLPGVRSVLLPPVPAQSQRRWGLPLRFTKNCPAGRYQLQVQFFQGETPLGDPIPFEVQVGANAQPQLDITASLPDSGLTLGHEGFVSVEVRNNGSGPARGLTLRTTVQTGARLPAQVMLGDLAAGGKISYKLPVLPENTATGPQALHLLLRVTDEQLLYSAATELTLDIAAGTPPAPTKANYTVAVWVYPNPDNFDHTALVWPQEEITVQIKIVSSQPVTRQQFCLEINGIPCPTGVKFEEVQIKGDRTSKTFSQSIRLSEGNNIIKANIQTKEGTVSSEPLKIVFTPSKPNLHVVSIGIPSTDLKYTVKDARDFAQTLTSTQNIAFGKIFLDTLLTEERTTKTEMLKALRRLQYRYTDLQILPKDLLIIFVSGHGLGAYDGSFRIAASDYDSPFMQETSLDFEQEIVNYLQSLPCNKLFFVDACHSGTASSTGLAGIATRKNGLNLLVSCRPNEYSYEDNAWQNGAFTHALVRGLDFFAGDPTTLDRNADHLLDAGELFGFIEKEVPKMVEKKRPKPNTAQHPNLFLAEPGKAPILFKKNK